MGKISVSLALLCLALSAVFLICTDQGVEAAAPLPRFRGREEVKGKKKTRSFVSSYIAGWLNYISSRLFWTYKLWSYSLTVLSTPTIILINKVHLGANKLFSLVSNLCLNPHMAFLFPVDSFKTKNLRSCSFPELPDRWQGKGNGIDRREMIKTRLLPFKKSCKKTLCEGPRRICPQLTSLAIK